LECFGVSAGSSRGREPTEHRRARSQVTWSSMSRVSSSFAAKNSAGVRRSRASISVRLPHQIRYPQRKASRIPGSRDAGERAQQLLSRPQQPDFVLPDWRRAGHLDAVGQQVPDLLGDQVDD
jgi:hypothetical protein